MVHDAYVENPSNFHKLLEEAEMPLYPECKQFTKLSVVVKLYNLKAKYGWSDTSFTELLMLMKELLPEHNVLPSSLFEAKKSLSTLGMKYKKIHACPRDCILYRNEHAEKEKCPICGESRWKVFRNGSMNEGVPAKVLWYFPPIPRFQRLFGNKETAHNLTWHARKRVCDGHLRHPADAPTWKIIMTTVQRRFNMNMGVRGRNNPLFDVVKCQQQPDGKQCGFYVMRYMMDIVENCGADQPIPIPSLFNDGRFTCDEIDEVRAQWADFVYDLIDNE